jgi:hypothetical protein
MRSVVVVLPASMWATIPMFLMVSMALDMAVSGVRVLGAAHEVSGTICHHLKNRLLRARLFLILLYT